MYMFDVISKRIEQSRQYDIVELFDNTNTSNIGYAQLKYMYIVHIGIHMNTQNNNTHRHSPAHTDSFIRHTCTHRHI